MSVVGRALGAEFSSMMSLDDTELTLGLPGGETRVSKSSRTKRSFSETIDLSLGGGSQDARPENEVSDAVASKQTPVAKMQVVGWPPVKSSRKNAVTKRSCKFVKVAVDGAPYLRKVDLETYNSYEQLLDALENMFSCFTISKDLNERKLMDLASGVEYMPTYEDKDEDWMLVGDVPWKMFVESCKRIRLMKSSEAIGLAAPRGSGSSITSSSS